MRSPSLGWSRLLSTAVLVGAAAILLVGLLSAAGSERLGHDFRAYLIAAEAIRDGGSPYPSPESQIVDEGRAYVYPPLLALAVVPLTTVPADVGAVVGFLLALAALVGALAVVGVRDIRCYAAMLVSAPVWNALEMANFSAAIALGVALAWRLRSTVWPLALTVGIAVSSKLFVWPLVVWTAATGRYRASFLAAIVGVLVAALSWTMIGFDGLTEYPALVDRLADALAGDSYSFIGLADALGLDPAAGRVAMFVVGGSLLAAGVALGRAGDDRQAFTCAVAAGLAFAPILWQHHLVILFVPLALARPRFSAWWLLPSVLWLGPRASHGDGFEPVLVAGVIAGILYVSLARTREVATPVQAT
jgi:hypothetical protein